MNIFMQFIYCFLFLIYLAFLPSGGGNNSNNGLRGFVNRVTSVINPNMNLSAEKDYDGNTNPIQNVIQKESTNPFSISGIINRGNPYNTSILSENTITNNRYNSINNSSQNSLVSKIANTGYNATKEYLKMGAKLTEGDFGDESYKSNNRVVRLNNIINPENRFRNNNFYTDYTDKLIDEKKLGEVNEFKGKS